MFSADSYSHTDRTDGRGGVLDGLLGPEVYRLPIDRVKGEALPDRLQTHGLERYEALAEAMCAST